ncbi:MAG: RluA family pseudouridine synthase [Bacteroidales bacterium]
MSDSYIHTIPADISAQRLSDYGGHVFPDLLTRSGFKKAIKRGEVYVDGHQATTATMVKAGMEVSWIPKPRSVGKVYLTALEVLFEDEYLAIIKKPAGIVVSGNRFKTIEHALPGHLKPSYRPDALPAPMPVHRLDAMTSGLLLIAKTRNMQVVLGQLFQTHQIDKSYQVVVIGETPEHWTSELPLEGKAAKTFFRKIKAVPSLVSGCLTLLEAQPLTGRKHQIRKHLWLSGWSILGDKKYAHPGFVLKHKGMFLCATELRFYHPVTNEKIALSISPPQKFERFLAGEKKRFLKYADKKKPENTFSGSSSKDSD